MKLDKHTLDVLKNFSKFNDSIMVYPGRQLQTIASNRKLFAQAEVPDEFGQQFAIHKLSRFFGSLSLFADPEIVFHDKFLTISQDARQLRYVFAAPTEVLAPDPAKKISLKDPDASFVLAWTDFAGARKAADALGHPDIVFAADGKRTYLKTSNKKDRSEDEYAVAVADADKEYGLVLKAENLLFLPDNYRVDVHLGKCMRFTGSNKVTYTVQYEVEA